MFGESLVIFKSYTVNVRGLLRYRRPSKESSTWYLKKFTFSGLSGGDMHRMPRPPTSRCPQTKTSKGPANGSLAASSSDTLPSCSISLSTGDVEYLESSSNA